MKPKTKPTVIEKYLLSNPVWQNGYKSFQKIFAGAQGWYFFPGDEAESSLIRLDRKGGVGKLFTRESFSGSAVSENFYLKYGAQIFQNEELQERLPGLYKTPQGKWGVMFGVWHHSNLKGILFLSPFSGPEKEIRVWVEPFHHFLATNVELAYKAFEIQNFYETVHPRAFALSTMHSVHRVISSSLHLSELLPKIGRLSTQILKARGCSIMLVEPNREFLIPYFSVGHSKKFIHKQRVRLGRGLEGRIAKTGEFHLTRHSIGIPFIDDDVVGVLILWDKTEGQPFSRTDLEILKSLSEQAVVAIKNAQLYEETEQLTLGSIKTINQLLELNFGGNRMNLPAVGELILEIGKELELSSRELIHLSRAVLLIDTGALAFPEVWRKKGKLTKGEYEQIKRIPLRGADLLKSISSLKPVIPIIMHHRERYDGKGYPDALKGDAIPMGARIISVVDVFMAILCERTYQRLLSIEEAIAEIKAHRGTQFDPVVVDAFLRVIHRPELLDKIKALKVEAARHSEPSAS